MSGVRERKKREMKNALAKVATEIAAERGVTSVTANEVTEAVGVSTRTFHNYFSTREEAIAHHLRRVMGLWPTSIAAAPTDWDPVTVLMQTTYDNISNGTQGELTYADALVLSGALSSLDNMAPQDLLLEGLVASATELARREGFDEHENRHLVMVHTVWAAVHATVLGARGADDPESAFRPLLGATLKTAETILREGLFELPDGV